MTDRAPSGRWGTGLTEAMIASAILAVIVIAALNLIGGGLRGAAQAVDRQMVALLVQQAIDGVLLRGFETLPVALKRSKTPGQARIDLNLAQYGCEGETGSDPQTLITGGNAFKGTLTIDEISPGLIRLVVRFTWRPHPEKAGGKGGGSLIATRYVCDPMLGGTR